ncbi:MAG TPA: hypothetical protein VF209_02755 [Patescibacteria group bacterium]
MPTNHFSKISESLKNIFDLTQSSYLKIALGFLLSVGTLLQLFGLLDNIIALFINFLGGTFTLLWSHHYGVPWIYWLVIATALFILLYWQYQSYSYLKLVSGEFYDDFRTGLMRWNYGTEAWKTMKENGECILNISHSDIGGITQAGFWDSFSFSFKNKVLSLGKVGWIVKAWDRSNYIMLQLLILDEDGADQKISLKQGVYIRPHFRYQGGWIIWPHEKVSLDGGKFGKVMKYEWLDVEVQVRGNIIDVYLEGLHIYHLNLEDPLRVESREAVEYLDSSGKSTGKIETKKINVFSYPGGRVGFRCSGNEEANFKNVRIKPLW